MGRFALQILSEQFGRSGFTELSQDTKRRFSDAVTEIIRYNINVYNRLKMNDYIGTLIKEKKAQYDKQTDVQGNYVF